MNYYIRFGNLPEGGRSLNWIRKVYERGVSCYKAISNKGTLWEIDYEGLSNKGLYTLYLLKEHPEHSQRNVILLGSDMIPMKGLDDKEPVLDINQTVIIQNDIKREQLIFPSTKIFKKFSKKKF